MTDDDLISVTLTRAQWDELDRQASLYLGAACCDDPTLETIRAVTIGVAAGWMRRWRFQRQHSAHHSRANASYREKRPIGDDIQIAV